MDTHVGENVGENVRKECSTDNPTNTAKRRDRRSFLSEFKAEAVRLCKAGDRSIERVTKDLGHTKTALRSPATNVAELVRRRRENKQLLMDREIQESCEVRREGKPMRFAFLHIERAHFPISALCRVLELTRSGESDRRG